MPFTFAHPAAAVPLAGPMGRVGVLSALVIGSMAPDFAFLFPMGVMRAESHSLGGLFWYCLPVGLICYLLYHLLMKRPIIHLLPPASFARLARYATSDWALRADTLLPVLVSILVGAITHLAWDSFTHRGSWGVRHMAFLQLHLYTGGGFWIYLYTALQWFSSVLGLALLGWWGRGWLRHAPLPATAARSSLSRAQRWLLLSVLVLTSLTVGALEFWTYAVPEPLVSTQEILIHTLLGVVSGLIMALISYCAVWNLWHWLRATE
jgi:hypothetical protein